ACSTRTALRRSSSHPCAEKSPSDVPVPRKLNVRTVQPASLAMWSARSGYVVPTVAAPRGGFGRPWHSTSPRLGTGGFGTATWADSLRSPDRIVSSMARLLWAHGTLLQGMGRGGPRAARGRADPRRAQGRSARGRAPLLGAVHPLLALPHRRAPEGRAAEGALRPLDRVRAR